MHTGVVDESVDPAWTGFDLLERRLDRLVTGEIDLDGFDGVGGLWTIFVEGRDRALGFV